MSLFTANPISNNIAGNYFGYPFGTKEQVLGFNPPSISPINGKVSIVMDGASVMKSIGDKFITLNKSQNVTITGIYDGGASIEKKLSANSAAWTKAMQKVSKPNDVQVVVCMQDRQSYPSNTFPAVPNLLRDNYLTIFNIYKQKFPNVKHILLMCRPYAGYVTNPKQLIYKDKLPAPNGYYNGWACKFAAEVGIQGIWVSDGLYIWNYTTPENYFKKGDIHLVDSGNTAFANQMIAYFQKFNYY